MLATKSKDIKKEEAICLPLCLSYITWINALKFVWMYDTKPNEWLDYTKIVLKENWWNIKMSKKSIWRCICVLDEWKNKYTHAIVLMNWMLELNPHVAELESRLVKYFFILSKTK